MGTSSGRSTPIILQTLSASKLYVRRRHSADSSLINKCANKEFGSLINKLTIFNEALSIVVPRSPENELSEFESPPEISAANMICVRCGEGFMVNEQIVNSGGEIWHQRCFVCAQCFRPFPDGIFYELERRKYCEHDFHVLFAPCCARCGVFVIGRVIKAMNENWHPECFRCEMCNVILADIGFLRNAGRALCYSCNEREKGMDSSRYVCYKCRDLIDEEGYVKYKGEVYHPYHFNCKHCNAELTADARELKGELYCLRCHDKLAVPICGACRRPIEDRIVTALGKNWHVEHFVCARCEKPFLGTRHYEKKGLAYCETHYHQLFGNVCFVCSSVVPGDVFQALKKSWCVKCFACSLCDKRMDQRTKFYELDMKPACKRCYDKLPRETKKRLSTYYGQSWI